VGIILLIILYLGSLGNQVLLQESYNESFVCQKGLKEVCIDEEKTIVADKESFDKCKLCGENTVQVCMDPNDYKELYG